MIIQFGYVFGHLFVYVTFCDALGEVLDIHQGAFQVVCKLISLIGTYEASFYKDMARIASSVFVWANSKLFHVCVTHAQRPFFFIFPSQRSPAEEREGLHA